MRARNATRSTVVVLGVAAILLIGAIGWGISQEARAAPVRVDTSDSIAVTTTAPYMFDPNSFEQVPTNSTIDVTVTDADTLAHTFSILDLEGVDLPSSADIPALFSAHGALVSINVTGAGNVASKSFTSPGPGWYEFVCQEPGHFQSGMYGFIAFGMNLPANLSVTTGPTGPGAAVFIIIGSIVSMVVVAIVLGFVVGRRRGSEFEMPPERLGYAEPPSPGSAGPPGSPPLPPGH
ncbi:MAG TPA: hypothetical protein VEK13_03810 [Thermoplasmata archaeon]|nr:hypothetical protein [Thermoplasmata archaeon]